MESGALASDTVVMSGGVEIVLSGGTASGATISGGFMNVTSGGSVGSGAVTFAGSGTLQLDDSQHFAGRIGGFQSVTLLDLSDIPFVAGTTSATWNQVTSGSTASGTLGVTDGTHSANITLLGQYVVANFHIQNDGHGGTVVMDPPVSATTDQNLIALANQHYA